MAKTGPAVNVGAEIRVGSIFWLRLQLRLF